MKKLLQLWGKPKYYGTWQFAMFAAVAMIKQRLIVTMVHSDTPYYIVGSRDKVCCSSFLQVSFTLDLFCTLYIRPSSYTFNPVAFCAYRTASSAWTMTPS